MAILHCIPFHVLLCWLSLQLPGNQDVQTVADSVILHPSNAESRIRNCKDFNEDARTCTKCAKGYFGEGSCNKTCNTNCILRYCNIVSGSCKYGCINRSMYPLTSPWYGQDCGKKCNENCVLGTCSRNGTCYLGCQNGTYGKMCNSVCPENCIKGCTRGSGRCLSDCKTGFYGLYCNISCPENCRNELCYSNGTCYSCFHGYRGHMCQSECPAFCKCCHQFGDKCKSCDTGRYGQQCEFICQTCHDHCEMQDGRCILGCKAGYYGLYCDYTCGKCSGECDGSSGRCSNGCIPGYYGPFCKRSCARNCLEGCSSPDTCNACSKGYWAKGCNITCPEHCQNGVCYNNGTCYDCTEGHRGHMCKSKCAVFCKSCHQFGNNCTSCESGHYGNQCELQDLEAASPAFMATGGITLFAGIILITASCCIFRCRRGQRTDALNKVTTRVVYNAASEDAIYDVIEEDNGQHSDHDYLHALGDPIQDCDIEYHHADDLDTGYETLADIAGNELSLPHLRQSGACLEVNTEPGADTEEEHCFSTDAEHLNVRTSLCANKYDVVHRDGNIIEHTYTSL